MPFWTLFPSGPFSHNIVGQAWVPMDDTHTMIITVKWKKRVTPLGFTKTGKPIQGLDRSFEPLPNTTGWFGRWRVPGNAEWSTGSAGLRATHSLSLPTQRQPRVLPT